jgi:hypothetical protein
LPIKSLNKQERKRSKPKHRLVEKHVRKNVLDWSETKKSLTCLFAQGSVTCCEINLPGCKRESFLTFAHSRKRRHIKTQQQLEEVVLACVLCHMRIEALPEPKMTEIVQEIIRERTPLAVSLKPENGIEGSESFSPVTRHTLHQRNSQSKNINKR